MINGDINRRKIPNVWILLPMKFHSVCADIKQNNFSSCSLLSLQTLMECVIFPPHQLLQSIIAWLQTRLVITDSLLFQEEKKETKYNKSMIQNVLSTNFFIIYFCFSKFCFANTNQSDTIKAPPPKQNQAKQTTLCSWHVLNTTKL